jgi:hypothetical protein
MLYVLPDQAAKAPSGDLSQREVAAAQHLAEHSLHLQRCQRALLGRAAAAAARMRALSAALSAFAAASCLPSQVWWPLLCLFAIIRASHRLRNSDKCWSRYSHLLYHAPLLLRALGCR